MLSIKKTIENIKNKFSMQDNNNYLKDENGKKISFFHGTSRRYINHKNKHRTILNEKYQGDGYHYLRSIETAWKYAKSNRNQSIDRELFFKDLQFFLKMNNVDSDVSMGLVKLTKLLLEKGNSNEVWDEFNKYYSIENNLNIDEGTVVFFKKIRNLESKTEFNINDYIDILEYVEGSNLTEFDEIESISNFLRSKVTEIPAYINEDLEKIGFYRSIVEPRVIESNIVANNILETNNRNKAKNAFSKGYDLVIYNGEDCVDGQPEYMVKNKNQIKIKGYHILNRKFKEIDPSCTEIIETVDFISKKDMKDLFDKIYFRKKINKNKKIKMK
tara:strand:- start:133 stop:1119 length:987 start_codon:yes stop_codon:yes gene_type:complete